MLGRLVGNLIALTLLVTLFALAAPMALADNGSDDRVKIEKPKEGTYTGRWNGDRFEAKSAATAKQDETKTPLAKAKPAKPIWVGQNDPRRREALGNCQRVSQDFICYTPGRKKAEPDKKKPQINLSAVARTLVVRLQLPDPTPQIGPDPSVNEWKMAAVGYPLWLWTGGPRTVTSQMRAHGVTFTLRATWLSTDFDMGDGHRVTCTSTSAYTTQVKVGAKSPDCGYTYLTSSLPKGNYTVTATTNWRISWSALGQSGSLPGSYSGSRSLPVGELNALVVK